MTQNNHQIENVNALVHYYADELRLGLVWLCGPHCDLASHDHEGKRANSRGKRANSRGKRPIESAWQATPYQTAAEFLAARPSGAVNVGIRCGYVEGARRCVIALDLDTQENVAWADSVPELASRVVRRRGESSQIRVFKYDGNDKNEEFKLPGDEVKKINALVGGRQFVAPGMMHFSGMPYEAAEPWTPELLDAAPRFPREAFLIAAAKAKRVPLPAAREDDAEAPIEDEDRAKILNEWNNRPHKRGVRALRYLRNCKPSIEGEDGSSKLMVAARHIAWGFAVGWHVEDGVVDFDKDIPAALIANSDWNQKECRPPWSLPEIERACHNAAKPTVAGELVRMPWGIKLTEREQQKSPDVADDDLKSVVEEEKVTDFSHLHITQEFLAAHGADVIFLTDSFQWASWSGSHWQIGGDSEVRQKLSAVCNKMAKVALHKGEHAAERANDEADIEKGDCAEAKRIRAKAAGTAKCLRDGTLIGKVLLKLAQEPKLRKMRADFDQDEFLLACPSFTIDLRDGGKEWKPRREDLLTQCASVDPDFEMAIPTWERVQSIAFRRTRVENEEVQAKYDAGEHTRYINRCLGFALTGSLAEHALFVWHGAGENFKGTQLNTINNILGPSYCATLNRTTITKQPHGEKHSQDVATREYKRLVITDEIENSGTELDVGRIKQLVSSDPVYARGMRENDRRIEWRAKIFSPQNVPATITNPGRDIERRLHYVPFCVPSREQAEDFIPHIDAKLRAERPGILALLIRSAREWHKNFKEDGRGLRPPEWIVVGSREFIRNGDTIRAFFDALYVADPKGRVKPKDLHDAYKNYMFQEHGVRFEDCVSATDFGTLMRSGRYPVEGKRLKGVKYYVGVRLNDIAARKAEKKRQDDAREAETA